MRRVTALLLACAAGLASAAPADYARQWPILAPPAPAAAYTVELTPEVYATVQRIDLRDLDVLDADGRPVPADVVAPASAPAMQRSTLPWYRMPAPAGSSGTDWRLIADLDADGRLRGLRSSAAAAMPAVTTLLLDAGALPWRPHSLEFRWRPGAAFDAGYRIEGSDDFDRWYALGRGRLVDIREGTRGLQVRRIVLDPGSERPRFLRLIPDDATHPLPDVTAVEAAWTTAPARAPVWRVLRPQAAGTLEFDSAGRYPVRWVDLEGVGNDVRTWRLQSRDTADAAWVDRTPPQVAYRVGGGRSPPHRLAAPVRDRYWRVLAGGAGAPSLRLGHVPERMVFIAGGRPPYTLVAGSLRREREARPVRFALDATGQPPATARLGPATARAGSAALKPERDWTTWGLWAVLGAGVLLVGGFALRLLREPARAGD